MLKSSSGPVPVYTLAGSNTARPLPEWLQRKRKRSLKHDPEFAHRVELLQDFGFEEASVCVRASEDGEWVMSTGTYKPQMHVHSLSNLSMSYSRHTNTVNKSFVLLSEDYTKSLHLQSDRSLEFHTPGKLHHTSRLPRYGRDLKYVRWNAEALVPAVGVNESGSGEVFRLNLDQGRFMKSFEVDVGGDDFTTEGGGALQGGINTGAVNCAAVAERSHNLMAFGTSIGTIEFFDPRTRGRVGVLSTPGSGSYGAMGEERDPITALEFHASGLNLATGSGSGIIHLYDLRNPLPYWRRDQGYGYAIQNLIFIDSPTSITPSKLMTSDKRIIKLWDYTDASFLQSALNDHTSKTPWTTVEPAVDLTHVEHIPNSGMLLTANEGGPQHIFFIPQLGPAPSWCRFIDNLVEEMAEDHDPQNAAGQVYDNFKFVTLADLRELNMDHLVGQAKAAKVLRPYMHGYFVDQRLYEQARLISRPDLFEEQRAKSVREKIEKERESRIRGNKSVKVKVNKALAERMAAREEKREARRAMRKAERSEEVPDEDGEEAEEATASGAQGLLSDPRFKKLFEDEDFEIDESSRAFAEVNPSTKPRKPTGLTAVEAEEMEDARGSSDSDDGDSAAGEEEEDTGRIASSSYTKKGQRPRADLRAERKPKMLVSSSAAPTVKVGAQAQNRSFGSRAANFKDKRRYGDRNGAGQPVVGDKSVTFTPAGKKKREVERPAERQGGFRKDRRSASGNVFRRM